MHDRPSDPCPRPGRHPDDQEHGHTAEDRGGYGHGEEGFLAEDYPGNNPLRGESDAEREHRTAFTWSWPQPTEEDAGPAPIEDLRSDRSMGREIARRVVASDLDVHRLELRITGGIVRLEGRVETDADRAVIEQIARETPGVERVEGELEIASRAAPWKE